MTEFKHYEIKLKQKTADKSILIKSVYEHNLYKELNQSTTSKKGLGKKNN